MGKRRIREVKRYRQLDVLWQVGFSLLGVGVFLSAADAAAEPGRWAVVAGNNHAGPGRASLSYALEDARKLARVLEELGHFPAAQIRLLQDATPAELLAAVRRSGAGAELLVVYYSGHADGQSLLMGEKKLGIGELKQAAREADAEVALVILDACNAGAAIQTKGGRSAPSFVRFTDSRRARGRVILTSASASELAQESDDIGGSVFTHYLVSGLRGDADRSGDRRVSLEELYRYVYDRTVHRTVDTLPGVQHPAFSYDLRGEGSIVLTDLNDEDTGMILPEESAGDYLIFDRDLKTVVAEVHKRAGDHRLIPLPPGNYTLKKRLHDRLLVAELALEAGRRPEVDEGSMRTVEFEHPTAKGWDLALRSRPSRLEAQALAGWTAFLIAPAGGVWSVPAAGAGLRLYGWPGRSWVARLAVTAGAFRHENPVGLERVPFTLVALSAGLSAGRTLRHGPYAAEAGALASAVFLQRRFDHDGFGGTDETAGPGAGLYAQASVQLGRVRLALEISGGLLYFPSADRRLIPSLSGGLTLGFGI